MKRSVLLLFLSFISFAVFAQPANDDCSTAQAIGALPNPAACPSGVGAAINIAGSLATATAPNPYVFMNNCSGTSTSMGSPADDVWYTFVATGYQLQVNITGTIVNPNIAMYSGTCGALGGGVGGCTVGTAGGNATLIVNQLVPGTTYYLQVSNNSAGAGGTFNMSISNSQDCNNCMIGSVLTPNPLPVNGMYLPGQVVNFCFTVNNYSQINTNWMHGVQVSFGSGWSGISGQVGATPLGGSGTWSWFNSCTSTATGATFGQGFYMDLDGDGNPGNNFGDNCDAFGTGIPCPAGTTSWTFCFNLTVAAACNPGSNLSVTINTSGDGESGSWSNTGCAGDPATVFNAMGSCCPPTMASTAETCIGNDGTATATPIGGAGPYTFDWSGPAGYTNSTSGPGASTITGLDAGTYTVVVTDANLCAVTNTVTVANGGVPPAAPGTTPVTYCQNAAAVALIATPSAGGTLNWYGTNAVGGVASGTAPTPSTAVAGTTTYYVSQTVGGCEGPRAPLVVTVNPTPLAPTTAPVGYCQGAVAVPLTATPSAGGTLNWYGTTPPPGASSGTAPTPSTAAIGTTTYYVTQTILGCEGPAATLVVTIATTPGAPATGPVVYCQNDIALPLTATPSGGATLNWYGTTPPPGASSATAPTPSTVTAGTTTYYVTQSIGTCEGPAATLVVTVNASPAAPATTPVTYCQNAAAVALIATPSAGGTLNWYGTNAVGGIASGTAPTPSTALAGTTTYYVSQTVTGCESPRAPLVVTVNATPTAPVVPNITYCQNDAAAQLSATPSAGGTLNWYGTVPPPGASSGTAPTPSTAAAGVVNYYVTQTILGCEGPAAVLPVTVNALPLAPGVNPVTYCENDIALPLSATPSAGATLNWYGTTPPPGASSGTAPTPLTTPSGSTTYYVTQTLLGCEGPAGTIMVTINAVPAAPAVTTPVVYCQNDIAISLAATPSGGATLLWWGTNAVGGTSSSTAPTPTTAVAGTTTYYVSQTENNCESPRAPIVVTVNATPALPTTTPVTYCENDPTVALIATPSAGATLNWYGTNAVGGTASATPPTPVSTPSGNTTYYVSQTINNCESPRAPLLVTINALPPAPVTTSIEYCLNNPTASLFAGAQPGASLLWWGTSATGGTSSGTAPVPTSAATGTTTYYVSQLLNGCEGPRAPLDVIVHPLPTGQLSTILPACAPLCSPMFFTSASPLLSYNWNLGNGLFSGNDTIMSHCYTSAGVYSISISVTDTNACSNTLSFPNWVNVYAVPEADFSFGPQPTTISEPEITFINMSSGQQPLGYYWNFGDILGTSSSQANPYFSYQDTGSFNVTLVTSTVNGCRDTMVKTVIIDEDFAIYVPNAFSPNNDGTNDFFFPKGVGVDEKKYQMWIFDRWGNMIFYTNDWNTYWDGKVQGHDNPVQQDVYIFKIQAHSYKGERVNFTGHVTVVR